MARTLSAQWIIVAVPGLGALAMFAVLAFGWVQTRRSAELLLRGEADLMLEQSSRFLRESEGPPTEALLRELVERERDRGLTFVAMLRPEGSVIAASEAAPPELGQALQGAPGDARIISGQGWVRSRPLPRRPPPGGPGGPTLVVRFEPKWVTQVQRSARATLLAGVLGALGLLALSLFSRRLLRSRDEALLELSQERRLASLGTMSAVVAHELRNPLATLKGHAQLLVEFLAAQPREQAQAQLVVDSAWRLERLSTSLLELARTGSVAREESSPVELVRAAVSTFDAAATQLEVNAAPQHWSLDPVRFQQVIINLVENGLQAAPGKPVVVRVGGERGRLIIEVNDRGPGVPLAERERIFEAFVTNKVKGIGLGLALARQVVALHGGTLAVSDAPGGGACFRVELPRG